MKLLSLYFIFIFSLINPYPSKNDLNHTIKAAIEAQQRGDYTQSIELLITVKEEAEKNKWYKELFLTYNNLGANYYLLTDYGEALENYLTAYDIALSHLDRDKEMVILNNVGILFYEENKLQEAEAYFLKAYEAANQLNITLKKAIYATNLALLYNKKKELTKGYEYAHIAIPLLKDNTTKLLQVKFALGENLFLKQDYVKAREYLIALIPELQAASLFDQVAYSYLYLSKISLKEQNFVKARHYINKASTKRNSLEAQIDVYQHASLVDQNSKNLERALQYRDSIFILKDSLYTTKSNNQFESNRVKFSIKEYENEMAQKEKEASQAQRVFIIVLLFAIILLLILLWAWRTSVTKIRQKKIIAERNQKIKMLELKQELDAKNRTLTVKALGISTRNTLLQEVRNSIKNDSILSTRPDFKQLLFRLNQLIKKENNAHDFLIHFEKTNQNFLGSLRKKHPNLNSNDVRFLSYLFMDLSIKEMSNLLQITPDATRKRKERIAKKMGLEKTANLYPYLTTRI